MARDWRRVALAAIAAAALAGALVRVQQQLQAPSQAARRRAGQPTRQSKSSRPRRRSRIRPKRSAPSKLPPSCCRAARPSRRRKRSPALWRAAICRLQSWPRRLYLRGIAYRQQSKPALAISDLTSALWLKGGLGETDRADALKQRSAAYADAGLTETGEADAARRTAAKERASAPGKGWTAVANEPSTRHRVSQPSTVAATGSRTCSAHPVRAGRRRRTPPPSTAPSLPQQTASIRETRRRSHHQPRRRASPRHGPAARRSSRAAAARNARRRDGDPAPAAGKPEGKFRVQLAIVRTKAEAHALAAQGQARARGCCSLPGKPEIDQTVLGNMGSFYRVRVGPFATAAGNAGRLRQDQGQRLRLHGGDAVAHQRATASPTVPEVRLRCYACASV